jgi:hypothetical protein
VLDPTRARLVGAQLDISHEQWKPALCGMVMAELRYKFDPEFDEGAVRIVRETGKSIAQIARDLKVSNPTLLARAAWVCDRP